MPNLSLLLHYQLVYHLLMLSNFLVLFDFVFLTVYFPSHNSLSPWKLKSACTDVFAFHLEFLTVFSSLKLKQDVIERLLIDKLQGMQLYENVFRVNLKVRTSM